MVGAQAGLKIPHSSYAIILWMNRSERLRTSLPCRFWTVCVYNKCECLTVHELFFWCITSLLLWRNICIGTIVTKSRLRISRAHPLYQFSILSSISSLRVLYPPAAKMSEEKQAPLGSSLQGSRPPSAKSTRPTSLDSVPHSEQSATPSTEKFNPGWRFYLAFASLSVITLMAALDATSLAVALPVRL
jgi:hypothetical protein